MHPVSFCNPFERTAQVTSVAVIPARYDSTRFPGKPLVEFTTLTSDTSFNDGRHEFEPSPDGARCSVHTTFVVKPAPGGTAPSRDALRQATHDSFLAAIGGVRKRAAGGKG